MLQTGLECVQVGEADPVWWVEHQELSLQEGEESGQKECSRIQARGKSPSVGRFLFLLRWTDTVSALGNHN